MHIPWGELELLFAIADSGSLSAAAKALRVTRPTVSRRLADLEAEASVSRSSPRHVDGTDPDAPFGERMVEPARRPMAESASEVERVEVGRERRSPHGVVRITGAARARLSSSWPRSPPTCARGCPRSASRSSRR